jgi:adenosine deaminase CECR1
VEQRSAAEPYICTQLFIVEAIIAPMKKGFGGLLKRKRSKLPPKMASLPNGADEKMHDLPNHVSAPMDLSEAFSKNYGNLDEARKDYDRRRKDLIDRELETAWDKNARKNATDDEKKASKIIWTIREHERDVLFGNIASEAIPGPETLDMGGQFLSNKDRVMNHPESRLYKIARRQPKGCHLHLHFNAELAPEILLAEANKQDNMFIRSTQPIVDPKDYLETEIVFNVMPEDTPTVDIWSLDYNPEFRKPGATPWMRWSVFKKEFESKRPDIDVEHWVRGKMVLSEEEVYGQTQTTNGSVYIAASTEALLI